MAAEMSTKHKHPVALTTFRRNWLTSSSRREASVAMENGATLFSAGQLLCAACATVDWATRERAAVALVPFSLAYVPVIKQSARPGTRVKTSDAKMDFFEGSNELLQVCLLCSANAPKQCFVLQTDKRLLVVCFLVMSVVLIVVLAAVALCVRRYQMRILPQVLVITEQQIIIIRIVLQTIESTPQAWSCGTEISHAAPINNTIELEHVQVR